MAEQVALSNSTSNIRANDYSPRSGSAATPRACRRFTALPLYRSTASDGPGGSRASGKASVAAKAQEGATALLEEPESGKTVNRNSDKAINQRQAEEGGDAEPAVRFTALPFYRSTASDYPQNEQSIRNGAPASSLMDCSPIAAPYSSIQPFKEEEIKRDRDDIESIRLTALALENEGVFPQPALEIAVRATGVGLDMEATLELFWAHKAHAASSARVKDPLAAATRRLQRGALKMPKGCETEGARAEFRRALRAEALDRWSVDTGGERAVSGDLSRDQVQGCKR